MKATPMNMNAIRDVMSVVWYRDLSIRLNVASHAKIKLSV